MISKIIAVSKGVDEATEQFWTELKRKFSCAARTARSQRIYGSVQYSVINFCQVVDAVSHRDGW